MNSERARVVLLCLLFIAIAMLSVEVTSFSQGPNNRNVSVDTRVNVSGSAPEILSVYLPSSVTLGAGSITMVTCNVSVRDYNSFGDISNVNATYFSTTVGLSSPNDNSTHYTNSSCSVIVGQQDGALANYTCSFPVMYYAVNGTWNCTAYVNDSINLTATNSTINNISALLALNVSPTLIDYGVMSVGDTSSNVQANVSNLGNRPINVTVRGYGAALNDGWSFICEQGNLTVGTQHFAANASALYAEKQALASAYAQVGGLTISKALNNSGMLNSTYWQLNIPQSQNVFGICNGTIVFQAESS